MASIYSHPLTSNFGKRPPASPFEVERATNGLLPSTSTQQAPEILPHAPPPTQVPRIAAVPGGGPPVVERVSVKDVLGTEGLRRSSIMRVSPTPAGASPRLAAPQEYSPKKESGLKRAWNRFMEMTPGTDRHKKVHGNRWSFGGYRSRFQDKRI